MYIYWKYDNVIDDNTIQKILDLQKTSEWTDATFGDAKSVDEYTRKTDIIWSNEQWLYDDFWKYMHDANIKAGWNLEVDSAEDFQLGRYPVGGHSDWHMDGNLMRKREDPSAPLLDGKTRKISMVIWLNEDFEGGEFEFHESVIYDTKIKPSKGTVLLFPSHFIHKVHPVTKGQRFSLVTWFYGEPIK